ncbi:hypothetical protein BJX96DRAFT_159009 [Aspergillus floccosus]
MANSRLVTMRVSFLCHKQDSPGHLAAFHTPTHPSDETYVLEWMTYPCSTKQGASIPERSRFCCQSSKLPTE